MADSFVQVAPDSTGKQVESQAITNGGGATVYRQNVVVSDPTLLGGMQSVKAGGTPSTSSDAASVVLVRPDSTGSAGTDASANAPTWPNIGAAFGGSSPLFPSWVLLGTVAASSSRLKVTVDNMSVDQILCLRDDGTAASGDAPVNATGFTLNPKVGTGPAGGHFESTTFRGRLQIYGASSSQFVAISTD